MGVLLPAVTFGIEIQTRLCATEWFDPLPTPFHVVAVVLVPVMNALVLVQLARVNGPPPRWMRWGQSLSVAVAAVYALIFLPPVPIGVLAIVFFGMGLLPLSPLLAFVSGMVIARRVRRRAPRMPGEWLVWIAAPIWILGPLVPAMIGHYWIVRAVEGSPGIRQRAVDRIRRYGDLQDLLRLACDQRSVLYLPWGLRAPCNADFAQSLYFRVTGHTYNSVPAPVRRQGRGLGILPGDQDPDAFLGGEAVAGRVAGLRLEASALEVAADATEGWGYGEWTLEFKNQHPRELREARALLQLPPGGVVSRVTLWVNGEEREAAFADRAVARAAYQQVAVQQRRDPVLVTTAGPDRVLMQCFPVPAGGGRMKVRIGITAPLEISGPDTRRMPWPRIVERNFGMASDAKIPVRLKVTGGDLQTSGNWNPDPAHPGRWTGTLAGKPGEEHRTEVRLRADTLAGLGWALDDRGETPAWIHPRQEVVAQAPGGPLAVVLDGGSPLGDALPALRQALGTLGTVPSVTLWLAQDDVQSRSIPGSGIAAALESWRGSMVGGHDNQPALEAAVDSLRDTGGTVLWIHGPQPAAFEPSPGLRAGLDRAGGRVVVFDVAIADGPDVIAERMDGLDSFRMVPRVGTWAEDLGAFLAHWTGRVPQPGWVWERTETPPGSAVNGSAHLVRLWAVGEVRRALREGRLEEARRLAARWHLVTPVTGAVVLETREQYERNGLKPVDPRLAPTAVPEPETWALLAVGVAMMFLLGGPRRREAGGGLRALLWR